ncbi:MAG: DUF3881 family protein [Lachnospiraceae bacterium]|nr:DUF3881 family protein [Lachnospiraceae bacterium]
MHSYLRAIGFSNIKKNKEIDKLLNEVIEKPTRLEVAKDSNGNEFTEFSKEFGGCIGITACGEYTEDDEFQLAYYYPYFCGTRNETTSSELEVEKHAEKESYAGICDEMRLGVTLIFYLQNVSEYLNEINHGRKNLKQLHATLSALSLEGKILLPIQKTKKQIEDIKKSSQDRNYLIAAAREGDEDAIENLTLEDIDTYSMISRRIANEDVLSIVDTYFMPYGIESDQYSILGEILNSSLIKNRITEEEIYILTINSNDLIFDLCINKKDLFGEPLPGRRFKGNIWMQGRIEFNEF